MINSLGLSKSLCGQLSCWNAFSSIVFASRSPSAVYVAETSAEIVQIPMSSRTINLQILDFFSLLWRSLSLYRILPSIHNESLQLLEAFLLVVRSFSTPIALDDQRL